jgi:hypothetical protein
MCRDTSVPRREPQCFFLVATIVVLMTACATGYPVRDSDGDMGCGPNSQMASVCSSYHAAMTNFFAALARGDVATSMYYLATLTGATVSQQQAIINGLMQFFDEGNQIAGKCGDVARGGFTTLSELGNYIRIRPYFFKLISTDGPILGFQPLDGKAKQMASNGVHVAVKFAGRIFDAYTGPGGMEESRYLKHVFTYEGQKYAYKEYASYPGLYPVLE